MDPQAVPYVISLIIAAVISLGVAIRTRSRHPAPGAASLTVLMLGAAGFAVPYAMQIASGELATTVFWYKVSFPGAVILTPAWIVFALQYTGREEWLTPSHLAALGVIPALTLLLGWTNGLHGLYGGNFRLDTGGPFPMLLWTRGVGFWIHAAYAYVLSLAGTVLLVRYALRAPSLYRWQTVWLLVGAFAPVVGNVVYFLDLGPISQMDLAPFTFPITGLAWTWGLYRHRLLDVVPVARDVVVENMDDSVIVVDGEHRILDANPAALDLIGRSASEVIGSSTLDMFSRWPHLVERYQETTRTREKISLNLNGDGSRRHLDLRISPLHDRQGNVRGRVIIARDVTERVQAGEALLEYAEALARSNAELEQFAYVASHHLQEPLRMVTSYLQFLERRYGDQLDAEAQQFIDYAVDGADQMRSMIQDLLDLSRADKKRDASLIDCGALVDRVLDGMAWRIEEHDAQVTCDPLPTVRANRAQLGHVFQHLLTNAIKFQPSHSSDGASNDPPRVHVSAERQGEEWLFSVRDNGIGIEPAYTECIFDIFQRLHNQEEYPGTGIGLAISKKIVERHGGQIWVESEPGEGSTFYFTIPTCSCSQD